MKLWRGQPDNWQWKPSTRDLARNAPLHGVFSTRSQDRPNAVGIHRVKIVQKLSPTEFKVLDLEAFNGTPIIDVKPVLDRVKER